MVMTVNEFIDRLKFAASQKTVYIKGCFGAPMTAVNKKRYTTNLAYNKNRASIINSCSSDTFGFDCVNLIKGILWGWNGDASKSYGGATYALSGSVPDINANGLIKQCSGVSTNFKNIVPGEVVWMNEHVGIYIGDGKVIECTPAWTNNVQYSNLGNIGYKDGHSRMWKKHGKLPWISYASTAPKDDAKPVEQLEVYYVVKKGDTLSKIAKKYNTTVTAILGLNRAITNANKIYIGQKIRVR
jgi:LysM repeat protein